MEYRSSLFSRFKKSLPCFLCNANVKNNENFCEKCKKSAIGRSPSPAPKFPIRVSEQENKKFFYLKSTSPKNVKNSKNSKKNVKKSANFNDPEQVSLSIEKKSIEKSNFSIENFKFSLHSNRPQSSFDFNFIPVIEKSVTRRNRSKKKLPVKHKVYRISKSPIPELRPSTQMSKYLEVPSSVPHLSMIDSYNCHKNTLKDVCLDRNFLCTVGLDYQLCMWDAQNMNKIKQKSAHNRGVLHVLPYLEGLVTGAKDGKIKFWDTASMDLSVKIQKSAHQGPIKAIETVSEILVTGNENIKIWKNFAINSQYCEKGVLSICTLTQHTLVSGSNTSLKIWDLRSHDSVLSLSNSGPFFKSLVIDDHSLVASDDYCKFDIRGPKVIQSFDTGPVTGLCKAKGSVIFSGNGLGVLGKSCLEGRYSCVRYLESLDLVCAGTCEGTLCSFKVF